MKKVLFIVLFFAVSTASRAQAGYDIKINFKGCPDSTVYLARYFWDQLPIVDSAVKVRNGKIRFEGDQPLDKGVYFLANQARSNFYFQFVVDANQKFSINVDYADVVNTTKSDDKLNEEFFSYVKYMTAKNKELAGYYEKAKGKSKEDSTRLVTEKQKELTAQTTKFDSDFMARNKGNFVYTLMNLKAEKQAPEVPKASNGRPDSVYQYYYYKSHFFDGVDFKDERILHTPFFADKVKRYFTQMVAQHPDSMIKELDMILGQCAPGTQVFNTLVGHFTYQAEQNKTMSFDQYGNCNTFEKVFIHLADKYIVSGKTDGYYTAETIVKIKERIDILRNLLPGVKVSDLYMIDTTYGREVLKMGFDTAHTSESVTYLYNKNANKLAPMFKTLYNVDAKYTILVFWAADCGHCQKEIPKLSEELEQLKGKTDYKVFAVQTKEELYETWKKFIVENKLTDFIHVFDPVHLNALTLKERFDIVATPVIYLLDKDKKIIAKKLNHDQVVELIINLEKMQEKLNK